MKACPKCSAALVDDAEICKCGHWFPAASSTALPSAASPISAKKKPTLWRVVDVLAWGIGFSFGLIAGDLYYQASGAEESALISLGFPIGFSVLWLVTSQFITKHLAATVKTNRGNWIAACCAVAIYILFALLVIGVYVALR